MSSAVIVRAHLPAALERIRRRSIADTADGVPAHLTMLYPFIEGSDLDGGVRRSIAAIARRHRPFDYRLVELRRWPDTIYVAVDPVEPFVRLQADLAAAFPDHPIYGQPAVFQFVPHVSVVEGPRLASAVDRTPPDRLGLPAPARATSLELIASGPTGRWKTVWRIPLG